MKIFMATMGLGIGGAETHIVELAKELKARGHEVVIASNGGVYVAEVEAAGIRHYAVPMHRRSVGICSAPGPCSGGSCGRSGLTSSTPTPGSQPSVRHPPAGAGFPLVTSCHGVFQVSGMLKLLSNWGQRTLAVSEDIRDYLIQGVRGPCWTHYPDHQRDRYGEIFSRGLRGGGAGGVLPGG